MKRLILGASLVSASAAAPAVALADARITIVTRPREPPPPPQPEPVQRRDGWVWVGGHYEWRHGQYVWVGGHFVRERHGHAGARATGAATDTSTAGTTADGTRTVDRPGFAR